MAQPVLLLDFDSTLVSFETLEALADIALEGRTDAAARRAEIAALTDAAMEGRLGFGEALRRRLGLLEARREHVEALAARAADGLTRSVRRNQRFFDSYSG
ncbi:MAG TPA: phosphoglycerate dehydrogenase, partial [Caulobacteraceae bacterium]